MSVDEIVTTKDGRKHRVLYACGDKLFVKAVDGKKSKPAYKIAAANVTHREKPTK